MRCTGTVYRIACMKTAPVAMGHGKGLALLMALGLKAQADNVSIMTEAGRAVGAALLLGLQKQRVDTWGIGLLVSAV